MSVFAAAARALARLLVPRPLGSTPQLRRCVLPSMSHPYHIPIPPLSHPYMYPIPRVSRSCPVPSLSLSPYSLSPTLSCVALWPASLHGCPARSTQVPHITGEEPDGDGDETDEDYIIDYILNHRKQGRSVQYLVVWEGYSEEETTWEPASNIGKANPALKEYLDGLSG
jgi:hypothetical protein